MLLEVLLVAQLLPLHQRVPSLHERVSHPDLGSVNSNFYVADR